MENKAKSDINPDEMDLTSAERKATYDEIREYVMEQTGLHVTNAKRLYGGGEKSLPPF